LLEQVLQLVECGHAGVVARDQVGGPLANCPPGPSVTMVACGAPSGAGGLGQHLGQEARAGDRLWYDVVKETDMIELTEQQARALESGATTPPRIIDPRTKETFVLLRLDEYERLKSSEYDDSPWTRDELQRLAWEAGKQAGWEDMDEYDNIPEKK
jgi:hypothetical protein